jgi:hypothetical protein
MRSTYSLLVEVEICQQRRANRGLVIDAQQSHQLLVGQ